MDARVSELHCIMPIVNIRSVLARGILCHERAAKLEHASVAMDAIQERRDKKQVPGGLKLHQYANLYFHARNPMLFKRLAQARSLCILRISTDVLDLPSVVLSDSNASSDYVRFLATSQWRLLPFDDIYAMDWRHPDQITFFRQRSRKCAEVLVPGVVKPDLLEGAHVVDRLARQTLEETGFDLPITLSPMLFFR
jgi:hypothetical protein